MGSEMCIRDRCIQIKLTSRLLRRNRNHHRTYFFTATKKEKCHTKKTNITVNMDSNHGQQHQRDSNLPVHLLRFLHNNLSDCYVSIRTNRRLGKIDKGGRNSTRCRGATRGRSRPLLARSGGTSKVRHVQQSAHREVDLISI